MYSCARSFGETFDFCLNDSLNGNTRPNFDRIPPAIQWWVFVSQLKKKRSRGAIPSAGLLSFFVFWFGVFSLATMSRLHFVDVFVSSNCVREIFSIISAHVYRPHRRDHSFARIPRAESTSTGEAPKIGDPSQ